MTSAGKLINQKVKQLYFAPEPDQLIFNSPLSNTAAKAIVLHFVHTLLEFSSQSITEETSAADHPAHCSSQ
jgi:hypothetical protein